MSKETLLLGKGVGGYSGALVVTSTLLEEATKEDECHGNFSLNLIIFVDRRRK